MKIICAILLMMQDFINDVKKLSFECSFQVSYLLFLIRILRFSNDGGGKAAPGSSG